MLDFHVSVPHIARVYDYWLGGKDNFAADRALGEETQQAYPDIVHSVRANRAFLARSVRFLTAELGIRQFLDIGTGLPTADNVHEVAQRAAPDARVVYADNDPIVLTHARALLECTPQGALAYLEADMRDPDAILGGAAATLDFGQPVAVLLLAVMQLAADGEAGEITARLMAACAPGSCLVISHPASDIASADHADMVRRMNEAMAQPVTPRDRAAVTSLFDGLELVEPGVVKASRWRPDSAAEAAVPTALWAGVGRKPGRGSAR
jgi:hypothetical protein